MMMMKGQAYKIGLKVEIMKKYKILDLDEKDNIKDERYLRSLLLEYELDDIRQNFESYLDKELNIEYQVECVKKAILGGIDEVIDMLGSNWQVPIEIIKESEKKMIKDFEEKAIKLIDEFCESEYGEGITVNDTSKIDIMFTEYEVEDTDLKDTLSVQVYIDLINYRIWQEINNIKVYEEVYGSQKDMLEQLECLDFDAWTNLDELDTYYELKEKESK